MSNLINNETLEFLYYKQLQVDPEWSEITPAGFRWWPDKNVQTIELFRQEHCPELGTGHYFSIHTELFRSLDLTDEQLRAIHTLLMPYASMNGLVYDDEKKTLSFCCTVRVYERISKWMNPLISIAAALQFGEARIMGPILAKLIGAEFAISGPSANGIRPVADDLAELIAIYIAPMGTEPCRWTYADIKGFYDHPLNKRYKLVRSDLTSVTVEFPFQDKNSHLVFLTNQPHPRYGNGLFVLQTFPVVCETEEHCIRLAINLNDLDFRQMAFGYGFGSYCSRNKELCFVSFYPNCTYNASLMTNLYYAAGIRARFLENSVDGNGNLMISR